LEYKETQLPRFDFQSGMRVKGQCLIPRKNDVFLFEGIQILYPSIDAVLSRHDAYRSFYICPASSIEVGGEEFLPNEIRLCRRLVRDYLHRATLPDFTFYLWESVRSNEDRNIFPYVSHCHATIDSTMPYEIGILKPYLEKILPGVTQDPRHGKQASGILAELENVQALSADLIPQNSLYKEFI
jgi:uridine kinase